MWQHSHQAIIVMRVLNKFYTLAFTNLYPKYIDSLSDLFAKGKTQIIKNLLRLTGEIFSMGRVANIEKAIYSLLPIIIKKAALDLGHIKQMAQEALRILAIHCAYDSTFISNSFFN